MGDFKLRPVFLFSLIILVILFDMPAFAHKVSIFAWVEGDTVYTQSKFSKGKRVKNSSVIVFDSDGNKLLEGKTDDNGEFSFTIPKQTALKVVLKASMGHMAEWKIPFEEINPEAVSNTSKPESDIKDSYETSSGSQTINSGTDLSVLSESHGISKQEIKKLIDESLDRKLSPIMNILADSYGGGPGLTEIIGGIGYIFGLVGVAMYFTSRRKRNHNSGS
jgi:nickel transport protein